MWEKSKKEQAEGRLGPFRDIDSVDLASILLVPRFGVWERRAKGWRVRVIDDFKFNQANSAARLLETSFVDTVDDITNTAVGLHRLLKTTLATAGPPQAQAATQAGTPRGPDPRGTTGSASPHRSGRLCRGL